MGYIGSILVFCGLHKRCQPHVVLNKPVEVKMPAPMPYPSPLAFPAQFTPEYAALTTIGNLLYQSNCSLAEVNASIIRSVLEEAMNTSMQLLAAKTPQQYFEVLSTQLKPSLERMRSYQQSVASIAATTQSALTDIARPKADGAVAAGPVTARKDVMEERWMFTMNPFGIGQSIPGDGDRGYKEFISSMQTMMESAQAQFRAMAGMFLPMQNLPSASAMKP
jgi:phasin family protein